MFEIGDLVLHCSKGVCKIEDIREEKFSDLPKVYYIAKPIDKNSSTLYIPIDYKNNTIRPLLDEQEIEEVIQRSKDENIQWIDNSNARKTVFNDILKSDDTAKIIALIICIHEKKKAILANGKKFPTMDDKVLTEAKKKIHQEISVSLSIDENDVPEYILSRIK